MKVRIPPGVDDGQRIRVRSRGAAGANGGPPGDLFVVVHVGEHPIFGRKGKDLTVRVPITFSEAALGHAGEGADARQARDREGAGRDAERQDRARCGGAGLTPAREAQVICW